MLDHILFFVGAARAVYVGKLCANRDELSTTLSMGVTIDHVFSMTVPFLGGILWKASGYEMVFLLAAVIAVATRRDRVRHPAARRRRHNPPLPSLDDSVYRLDDLFQKVYGLSDHLPIDWPTVLVWEWADVSFVGNLVAPIHDETLIFPVAAQRRYSFVCDTVSHSETSEISRIAAATLSGVWKLRKPWRRRTSSSNQV